MLGILGLKLSSNIKLCFCKHINVYYGVFPGDHVSFITRMYILWYNLGMVVEIIRTD